MLALSLQVLPDSPGVKNHTDQSSAIGLAQAGYTLCVDAIGRPQPTSEVCFGCVDWFPYDYKSSATSVSAALPG
jgi:hypothetical protein